MAKASDNVFPKVITGMQTSDPAAPSDSSWKVYSKPGGIYARSSNGIVGPFGAGTNFTAAGSNSKNVSGRSYAGDSTSLLAPFDHEHLGMVAVTSSSSNTLQRPTLNLRAGTNIGFALSDTDGNGSFDTLTITGTVGGGGGGTSSSPGYEFDYTAITSTVSPTATTEGTANTVITGGTVAYDGATIIIIEFFAPQIRPPAANSASINIILLEDATVVGQIAEVRNPGANTIGAPGTYRVRRIPSNASHQYIVKAYVSSGTGTIGASTGGSGALVAAYLRVTRV